MDTRSLNKEILNIGVPAFLETLFTTFAAMIDSKMVAVMGVPAISAVSVTNQPRLFIFSVFFALQTVTTSLVAKYYGKNDPEEASKVFDHALKLVILLSLGLGLTSAITTKKVRNPIKVPDFSVQSGRQDLNLRPHGPQPCALAKLSHAPNSKYYYSKRNEKCNTFYCIIKASFHVLLYNGKAARRLFRCG